MLQRGEEVDVHQLGFLVAGGVLHRLLLHALALVDGVVQLGVGIGDLEAEREQIVLERGVEAWERYRAARIRLMEADFAQSGQEQFLQSLEDMVSATEAAAQNMADAFGSVGGAIGAITVEITRFASAQVAAAQRVAEAEREYGRASFQYADARAAQASAEINHYGNLASAAKGFFKEGSDGYKALLAAELNAPFPIAE